MANLGVNEQKMVNFIILCLFSWFFSVKWMRGSELNNDFPWKLVVIDSYLGWLRRLMTESLGSPRVIQATRDLCQFTRGSGQASSGLFKSMGNPSQSTDGPCQGRPWLGHRRLAKSRPWEVKVRSWEIKVRLWEAKVRPWEAKVKQQEVTVRPWGAQAWPCRFKSGHGMLKSGYGRPNSGHGRPKSCHNIPRLCPSKGWSMGGPS